MISQLPGYGGGTLVGWCLSGAANKGVLWLKIAKNTPFLRNCCANSYAKKVRWLTEQVHNILHGASIEALKEFWRVVLANGGSWPAERRFMHEDRPKRGILYQFLRRIPL